MNARQTASAQQGFLTPIESLYERHGAFIARIIERFPGTRGHVDDILQETFIVAQRRWETFDPKMAKVEAWLYGIAVNQCRNHTRAARRFTSFFKRMTDEPVSVQSPTPEEQVAGRDATRIVNRLMARLPAKQREVFALYELEELDGHEIAELLQIPLGTVWTRLHHARERFRNLAAREPDARRRG